MLCDQAAAAAGWVDDSDDRGDIADGGSRSSEDKGKGRQQQQQCASRSLRRGDEMMFINESHGVLVSAMQIVMA